MLCAETVDAEVGMEVAVDQEFFPDLHDNTSKAYKDFSNIFRSQVRVEWRELKGPPLVALSSGGSDVSPATFAFSDAEDLPKCAGVQGCGDPVSEVGDPSEAVETE